MGVEGRDDAADAVRRRTGPVQGAIAQEAVDVLGRVEPLNERGQTGGRWKLDDDGTGRHVGVAGTDPGRELGGRDGARQYDVVDGEPEVGEGANLLLCRYA